MGKSTVADVMERALQAEARQERNNAQEEKREKNMGHPVPPWMQWVQDHVLLLLLMIGGGVMIGRMMVTDISWGGNPLDGWQQLALDVQWVLLFLMGAACGGVAIRNSAAAAINWRRHEWGFLFVNVLMMLFFFAPEVWSGITVRSINGHPSPADTWIEQWVFGGTTPISFTDFFVSVFPPIAAFSWGFASHKAPSKSNQELAEERERKLAELDFNAQVAQRRQASMQGWAGAVAAAGRSAVVAARGETLGAQGADLSAESDGDIGVSNDDAFGAQSGGISDESEMGAAAVDSRPLPTVAMPKGWGGKKEIAAAIKRETGRVVSESVIGDWLGHQEFAVRANGKTTIQIGRQKRNPQLAGAPYIAPMKLAMPLAIARYGHAVAEEDERAIGE